MEYFHPILHLNQPGRTPAYQLTWPSPSSLRGISSSLHHTLSIYQPLHLYCRSFYSLFLSPFLALFDHFFSLNLTIFMALAFSSFWGNHHEWILFRRFCSSDFRTFVPYGSEHWPYSFHPHIDREPCWIVPLVSRPLSFPRPSPLNLAHPFCPEIGKQMAIWAASWLWSFLSPASFRGEVLWKGWIADFSILRASGFHFSVGFSFWVSSLWGYGDDEACDHGYDDEHEHDAFFLMLK